jgi:hypothetical protein
MYYFNILFFFQQLINIFMHFNLKKFGKEAKMKREKKIKLKGKN